MHGLHSTVQHPDGCMAHAVKEMPACLLSQLDPIQQLMAGAAWMRLAKTKPIISAVDLQVIEHVP